MTTGNGAFGARLRTGRRAAGLSQAELADRAGLSVRAISNLERGQARWPHPDTVQRLADALGLAGPARAEFAVTAGRRLAGAAAGPDTGGADGRSLAEEGRVVPRQLPGPVRQFTGRHDELAALTGLVDSGCGPASAVVISAISGTAGIGKTTLAVRWAHLAAEKFPDGQLYVNLRGFDGSAAPVPPAEAIRDFLGALEVPSDRIPASQEAQAALYRTLVTGKRLLIVLDNARDPDQVRPLLPGSPGCMVLVTSRAELTGLAATDGAHLLTLDLLTQQEACGLLASHLGIRRVAAEQAAADELIALCARLPLALAIAAARAAAHPQFPLTALAAELRGTAGRLDVLDTGQAASSVRAVFSWSYQQLNERAARLFRLLGLHPGPDIGAPAAASLAALPLPAARTALHALIRASLITELAPGRYTMHDLLRMYAAELAEECDSSDDRRAAAERMLDHYLYTADITARLLDADQDPYTSGSPVNGVTPEIIADRDRALAWFAAEHKVLLAVTKNTAENGFDAQAQQLAWILITYLDRGGHWPDLVASQHIALACSTQLGDLGGQAHAHRNLGRAHFRLGQANLARAHLMQAARLARRLGDQAGEARAHLGLSTVFEGGQSPRQALRSSLRALALAEAAGPPALKAMACNNVGYLYATLGDFGTALAYCQRAQREQSQISGPSTLEASIWDSLGYIYQHLGDHRQATQSYLRAAGLFRELGAHLYQAKTLSNLGDAYHAADDRRASRGAWEQALAILSALDHPDADLIRTRLAGSKVTP